MRIIEMTLHAFGKFENKTLEFQPGLNVIMGANEAGKSTLHSFIEAMFYGFYKPYVKKKLYAVEYESYLPWDHSGYSGTLTFEDQGQEIRLERTFTKGKDALEIYKVDTGEEITSLYDYDKVTRLHDMTMAHIGFNKVTYKNTVSLTQMQTRTEEDLIREIQDNMSNLASSHQSTISVERVLERIEEKKDLIGSNRKSKSPYYKLTQHLNELMQERKSSEIIHQQSVDLKVEENNLLEILRDQQGKEKILREKMTYLKNLETVEVLSRVEVLDAQYKELEDKIKGVKVYSEFDLSVVKGLQEDKEIIDGFEQEMAGFRQRQVGLKDELKQIEGRLIETVDIEQAKKVYEEANSGVLAISEQEAYLKVKEQEQEIIQKQLDLTDKPIDFGWSVGLYIGLGVVGLGIVIAGLFVPLIFSALLLLAIGVIGLVYKDKSKKAAYDSDALKIVKLKSQLDSLALEMKKIKSKINNKLMENDVEDSRCMQNKRDDALRALSIAEAKVAEVKDLEASLLMVKLDYDGMTKTIEAIKHRQKPLIEAYQNLLQHFHIKEESEIQNVFEKHLSYVGYRKDQDNLRGRMEEVIGKNRLEDLKSQVAQMKVVDLSDGETYKSLEKAQETLLDTMSQTRESLSAVMARANELGKSSRTVTEIDETIESAKGKKESYDRKLKVAQVMKEAVKNIAIEHQNNFAPVLNETLSSVIEKISDSKYTNIKVNPEMELTVFDQKNHKTVKGKSLSEGTIDMLYFGLRLGIAKLLAGGKTLPLILDDAFVQYDEQRMARALDLLGESSNQVLLFTCHKREAHYLEKSGMKFNLIEIS